MQSLLVLVISLNFLFIQRRRDYQGCFFTMHISWLHPFETHINYGWDGTETSVSLPASWELLKVWEVLKTWDYVVSESLSVLRKQRNNVSEHLEKRS